MATALTVVDIDNSGKTIYVTCSIVFSGSYSTGGDTVDLTTIIGKAYLGKVFIAGKSPLYGYGVSSAGYSLAFIPGTTLANGLMKVNTAAATELAAGAYPAGLTGDTHAIAGFAFDQNL